MVQGNLKSKLEKYLKYMITMLIKSQLWKIHQQHHLWISITYEVKVEQSSRGGDEVLKYRTLNLLIQIKCQLLHQCFL